MRIAVFGGWQIIDNKHMESTEARRLDSASRPMQDGADKSQTGWAGRLDYMWCDASSIAHLNLDSRRAREHADLFGSATRKACVFVECAVGE